MLYVLDSVLEQINIAIASHAPERGGALLGPTGTSVVSHFVFDPQAVTTSVTYSPSRAVAANVQNIERLGNLEYKGIVHSHPGGLDHPSGQDERELRVGLELNPHLAYYLAPIVTMRESRSLKIHELKLGEGKISFFGAFRADSGVQMRMMPVEVLSAEKLASLAPNVGKYFLERKSEMLDDLKKLRDLLGGSEPTFFSTEFEGISLAAGTLILDCGLELMFMCGAGYPVMPPLLLVTRPGDSTEQVSLSWNVQTPAAERLVESVMRMFAAPGPFLKTFGTRNGLALSDQPEQAYLAGWSPWYAGPKMLAVSETVRHEQFARIEGVLSPAIRDTTAFIAGLGSVGSYLAVQLARSGVGGFVLIDPEVVESANLSRSVYELGDIGKLKTASLARRLWNINPDLRLELRAQNLLDFDINELERLIGASDIVIGTTDDLAAQRALNHFAYAKGKPALFVGLYAGAQGGEVILSIPEQTACYQCATSTRHEMEQETQTVGAATDYGTGRLTAEIALGADIQHVSSAAVKMALSLLTPPHSEAKLRGFLGPAIENQMSYLTLSTVPDYWFYPEIFGETAGQFAYQSLWLTPSRRSDCPVCGSQEHRVGPREVKLRGPSLENLRNVTARGDVIEGEIVAA